MRIKFKVNTQWESAINICETNYVSFLEEEKEIRFILDSKIQAFYSVKVKNDWEFKRIEENMLLYGIYDLTGFTTMLSCNGGKDWMCINNQEEVKV